MKKGIDVVDTTNLSLFPDIMKGNKKDDKIIRDDYNLAKYPLCLFSKSCPENTLTFHPAPNTEWQLICNPEAGSRIPLGRHLDYLYAMLYLLAERTDYMFSDNTIYFTLNELVTIAGKQRNNEEYKTALEAINNYRWLGIRSSLFRTIEKGEMKYIKEASSIIQSYTLVGGMKKGRKKSLSEDRSGYVKVVFSDFIINNLRSVEMSKKLNFSFMMKLRSPLSRRYFRLIDAWKNEEISEGENNVLLMEKDVTYIARQLPLANYKYPSRIIQILDPIHKELKELQYLREWKYEKRNRASVNGTKVIWYFSDYNVEQALVYKELVSRGISDLAARNIVMKEDINNIFDCIRYYDIRKKDKEKDISAGYLITVLKNTDRETVKKFLSEHDKKKEVRRKEEEYITENKMKMIYDQHVQSKVDERIKNMAEKEKKQLMKKAAEDMKDKPYITKRSREISVDLAFRALVKEDLNLPSFKEWFDTNKNLLT